ncbi:MAG TPA: CopD family protein [bacterium]|nr:CopD family protein [bacterium]
MRRRILPPLLLALFTLFLPSELSAHGILSRTIPQAGTTVKSAPKSVTLVFSEPVDGVYSGATVVDAAGRTMSGRAVISSDGRTMTVPLNGGAGILTVRWRVLSLLDGHTTTGRFRFAIRAAPPATKTPDAPPADVPLPSSAEETQAASEGETDVARVLVRWIALAAVLLTAGTAFFQWLVIRPDPSLPEVEGTLRPIAVGSAIVMAVSAMAEFLLQASALLDLPFSGVLTSGALTGMIVDTKAGWSALGRIILAAILLVPATPRGRVFRLASVIWFAVVAIVFALLSNPGVVAGSRHFAHLVTLLLVATVYGLMTAVGAVILPLVPDLKLPEGAWAPPVASLMAVGAITISSHAAGQGIVAATIDWCHIIAAAAWIGGLLPLAVVLARTSPQDRGDLARRIVPRFSQVAGWSLLILVVTGIYSSWLHIPALRAFIETLYGRALLTKLLFVVPAIILGAVNRFVFRPRIAGGANGTNRRNFLLSVRAEVLLAGGIILAVAVLTITPPASVSYSSTTRPPVRLAGFAGNQRVLLTVSQERDSNRFTVEVTGMRSEADVQIALTELRAQRNAVVLPLASAGQGRFLGDGPRIDESGMWEVEVRIRSRTAPAVSVRFPLRTGAPARARDQSALQLLERAKSTLAAARTWSTVEQTTDGTGNGIVTVFEAAQPDRLRYRTSSNVEGIIIGVRRYQRQAGGGWEQDTLPSPPAISGPFVPYLGQIGAAIMGRSERCGSEACQVVLWETAEPGASFAGWIGLDTLQIHRLLMVAPSHFMTAELRGVNLPITITPP